MCVLPVGEVEEAVRRKGGSLSRRRQKHTTLRSLAPWRTDALTVCVAMLVGWLGMRCQHCAILSYICCGEAKTEVLESSGRMNGWNSFTMDVGGGGEQYVDLSLSRHTRGQREHFKLRYRCRKE